MNWDLNLISALIGIATGALGYWLTTFCIQPILKYRCVRSQVLSNLIYYAQVVETEDLNDRMKNLHWEGILANRKSAADLNAAIEELPKFYLKYLSCRKIYPSVAVSRLIGYSNSRDYAHANKFEASIRKNLGFPNEK